jgi:shikimate dehydrogenase
MESVIKSKAFFIIGDSRVLLSKSPAIFSAVMRCVGFKGTYEPWSVKPDELGSVVEYLRRPGVAGANVTVPYKQAIIPHLDSLSEAGAIIGAVNTIVHRDDALKGYNTNAIGFMDALSAAGFDAKGKSALVVGTGGAARAVVFILNWLGAGSIFVAGRDEAKARKTVDSLGGTPKFLSSILEEGVAANIVVNATSVSSPEEAPDLASQVDKLKLSECELVMDLNYGRRENLWEKLARKQGIPFVDGLSSLANQARRTFHLWTGIEVEPTQFVKALESIS